MLVLGIGTLQNMTITSANAAELSNVHRKPICLIVRIMVVAQRTVVAAIPAMNIQENVLKINCLQRLVQK